VHLFEVFSHWLLDFLMWPPSAALLYTGGPEIGLDLGNPIGVAIAFEFGVLVIGTVIYMRARAARLGSRNVDSAT